MENPEDIPKTYYYKAVLESVEGILNYSNRMADKALEMAREMEEQSATRA